MPSCLVYAAASRIYQLARNQADITLGMRSIVVIRLTDKARFFGANPYYNDDLETRWSEGWKAAQKACKTGKGPFD